MNRQAVLVFSAHKDRVSEGIIEYAGGFEIAAVSHQFVGAVYVNVVLVIKGDPETLRAHEERVSARMQVQGA
jgi:hypothetical protein